MSASPAFLLPAPSADVWISHAETLRLCGRTKQWLSVETLAGRVRFRNTTTILRNGQPTREFDLATLPASAQQRYRSEQTPSSALPLFPQRHLSLALAGKPAPRVLRPAGSVAAQTDKVLDLLNPILDLRASKGTRGPIALILPDGKPVDSVSRMVKYVSIHGRLDGKQVSERKVWRLLERFDQGGAAELARRPRSDSGSSRYFEEPRHQPAAALLAYLHLGNGITPGHSAQACYEMLAQQCAVVGLAQHELPTDRTVRAFLARITPALKVYATRGRKEFAERMMPYISRGYQEHANQWWVSDHAILDVEVINDCIPGAPQGVPVRLRLTAIVDFRSRFLVGYSWAWEGTSASIASALRHAVSAHGPCQTIYVDNGKDYCKVARGAVPGYLRPGSVEAEDWALDELAHIEQTGVLARLGIAVTHCIAHHPQSKHVERFFRTMHLTFCALWQTYTGGKPSERPDQTTALMMHTRRAIRRGEIHKSHHPLASELMRAFPAWLDRYHAKPHGGRGMNHQSPAQIFAGPRMPGQRPTPSPEELAPLLWEHKRVGVRECQVRVNKHDYAPTDALSSRLMLDLSERKEGVLVAYDPLDPARVAVLDDAGRLVTMLEAKRLVAQAPHDPAVQAAIAAMQQMRGTLTRSLKERHLRITSAGKQLGVMTPLELMAATLSPEAPVTPDRITPRKPRLDETPTTTGSASPNLYVSDAVDAYFSEK